MIDAKDCGKSPELPQFAGRQLLEFATKAAAAATLINAIPRLRLVRLLTTLAGLQLHAAVFPLTIFPFRFHFLAN